MIKTLLSFRGLGLVLGLLSISQNALAHTGMNHDSLMHSVFHVVVSAVVGIAVVALSFVVFKRLPESIKIKIKK